MIATRSRPDVGRMREALSGAHELWCSLGVVDGDVFVDPEEGLFVNVRVQPADFTVCCRVGALYSGDGFGIYVPLRKGEQVAVSFPGAKTFGSPFIVCRIPSREEKPPTEFDNELVLVKMKDGEHVKVLTSGGGQVFLVDPAGPYSAARAEQVAQALLAFSNQLQIHTHSGVTVGAGVSGSPVPGQILPFNPSAPDWRSPNVRVA